MQTLPVPAVRDHLRDHVHPGVRVRLEVSHHSARNQDAQDANEAERCHGDRGHLGGDVVGERPCVAAVPGEGVPRRGLLPRLQVLRDGQQENGAADLRLVFPVGLRDSAVNHQYHVHLHTEVPVQETEGVDPSQRPRLRRACALTRTHDARDAHRHHRRRHLRRLLVPAAPASAHRLLRGSASAQGVRDLPDLGARLGLRQQLLQPVHLPLREPGLPYLVPQPVPAAQLQGLRQRWL